MEEIDRQNNKVEKTEEIQFRREERQGSEQDAQKEERRHEIGEFPGGLRELLHEISAVQSVLRKLAEVALEKVAAVVADFH